MKIRAELIWKGVDVCASVEFKVRDLETARLCIEQLIKTENTIVPFRVKSKKHPFRNLADLPAHTWRILKTGENEIEVHRLMDKKRGVEISLAEGSEDLDI